MSVLPNDFAGRLIIIWPKCNGSPLLSLGVTLANAETGKPIVSALGMTITVDLRESLVAELTMLTDEHGHLLEEDGTAGPVPADENGDVYTGQFRWLITEMRVAESDPSAAITDAQRTQIRRDLAEELYDRHSGTCGCGCDCASYLDPDCERVTE